MLPNASWMLQIHRFEALPSGDLQHSSGKLLQINPDALQDGLDLQHIFSI
jgi:hypothetical protein